MKYLPLFFLLLISCTRNQQGKTFIDANPQADSERIFEDLTVVDSINLSRELKILNEGNDLDINDKWLIFKESMVNVIWVLNKNNLKQFYNISFSEGRGPGEFLNMRDIIVFNNELFITDDSQRKIVQVDIDGRLINEYKVELDADRIDFDSNGHLIIQSMFGNEYVYNLLELGGEVLRGFEKRNNDLHILMYGGLMKSYKGSLYFGGFSEPLIKKYSIETGNLLFSRSVINNYESKYNYATNEAGEFIAMAFTPAAIFAISGFDVFNEYIYVTNHHDGDYDNKIIDIYSADNGNYVKSYKTSRHPVSDGLAVDEKFIYSIEMNKKADKFWIVKYKR